MGFLPEETVYKLVFDDPKMNGLEIRVRSVPLGPLMDIIVHADRVRDVRPGRVTAEDMAAVQSMLEGFVASLIDWNLERRNADGDAEPVPTTIEGVRSQDLTLMIYIALKWIDTLSGVSAPLEVGSPSGELFPEESLRMEALSGNQSSLPMPA